MSPVLISQIRLLARLYLPGAYRFLCLCGNLIENLIGAVQPFSRLNKDSRDDIKLLKFSVYGIAKAFYVWYNIPVNMKSLVKNEGLN